MPHMPCLYNALCVELALQVVKRHSFWLLSYLNIPLAMGAYFNVSMRKQLGVFVCPFSIPLNSLFFKKVLMIIYYFKLIHGAKIYMDCAVPLLVFFLLESVTIW